MALARDVVTEAPASFTTSTSFTHTPVGTPKGVIVFVSQNASSTDENGSISYGGVSLTKQAFAHDTATELLGAYVDFVGAELRLPVALLIILVVLLVRPAGLFGKPVTRRV